ncbi:MAG: hypothetical protein IJZ53_09940 [Tyzzerella sp.]|nr:hypothetical protein [Tyzzerella sp.]
MNRKEYLRIVRKQIHFIFDRDSIESELNQHLQDSVADLMEDGLSEEEAELQAVAQMGNPVEVGKLLNQEHHPLLGYLWIASMVILLLLVYPAFILITGFGYSIINLAIPTVHDTVVETYPIGIEMELPTHSVKIDNITLNEEGRYYLTYRSRTKLDYSRAGWSSSLFYLEDSAGESIMGGEYSSQGFGVSNGGKEFMWPEDDLLIVVGMDGEKFEINLKEYCDETRKKTFD